MKKRSFETYLYSTVGIAAVFCAVVAGNFLASFGKQRIDLTADRAFTLSAGTRQVLARLDTPVQIRLYATRDENAMPVFLKSYAQRVEDLLGEYRQAAKGLIEIQKLDPRPDSDAEDSARLDGIDGQALPSGEAVYLGLSISMLDQKQTLPFLAPDRERLLEYDIARAIARVMAPDRPTIGVMSPLPVSGQFNPMMMQMGQRGSDPWVFYSELKRDFNVQDVPPTADEIPPEIKVLVVIHPKDIAENTEFAIDQFVLRGGKLVAFLDPFSALDPQSQQQMNPMMMAQPSSSSTLPRLLSAWGLSFDTGKVVADLSYVTPNRQGRSPAILSLTEQAFAGDDIVTGDADNALLAFAGAFSGTPAEGLTKTVLIKSSARSQSVEPMMARMAGEQIIRDFKASGAEQPLAIRLTGKFKTAFPDGKPKQAADDKKEGDDQAAAKDEKGAKDGKDKAAKESLKEAAAPGTVILFGDSDMVQDPLCVREFPNPFGERMLVPANGNLGIAQAAIEQLAGDSALIAVRARAVRERPFTVVRDMQAQAEENYRASIQQLEESLAETQRKLTELQRTKEGGQRFILSPEQQQELANFRKKEADVRKELKIVRRNLRSDIDALETRIKWLNIAAVPAAVTVLGLGLAVWKRNRAVARRA